MVKLIGILVALFGPFAFADAAIPEMSFVELENTPKEKLPAEVIVRPLLLPDGKKSCGEETRFFDGPEVGATVICQYLGYAHRKSYQLENVVPQELMGTWARMSSGKPEFILGSASCSLFIRAVVCTQEISR